MVRTADGTIGNAIGREQNADGKPDSADQGSDKESVGSFGGIDPKDVDTSKDANRTDRSESGKRPRGRQKGWRKAKADDTPDLKEKIRASKGDLDKSGIAIILLSIHQMAATALKASELKISPDEAEKLSAAACNVAQHYNIAPSEKTQAWCALIMVLGMVYYPRVTAIKARLDQERKDRSDLAQAV